MRILVCVNHFNNYSFLSFIEFKNGILNKEEEADNYKIGINFVRIFGEEV